MQKSQISYIRQKLQNLSKEDLMHFAKFTGTWIRPYWPKSEIAEAIISGEKEGVSIKLKEWARSVGKEKIIFTPESDDFFRRSKPDLEAPPVDKKTFSEEFLERWKKLSSKDEETDRLDVKMPPGISGPNKELFKERPEEIKAKMEYEKRKEKFRDNFDERMIIGTKIPTKPMKQLPVKPPAGLGRRYIEKPDEGPSRYTPFKSQFKELKKRIVDRVQDIRDSDHRLKEELLKETEELDKFMKKEFELKGIKFDEKESEALMKGKGAEVEKRDFDKHLKEIEAKLIMKELKPPTISKTPPTSKRPPRGAQIDDLMIISPKDKFDIHTGKTLPKLEEKEDQIELRAKFFDKYIKREGPSEDKIEFDRQRKLQVRKPLAKGKRTGMLGGRINGRGLINGVIYKKGLVNGYSSGLINGRINGKGLINGMMIERTSEENDVKKKIRRIGLIRAKFHKRMIITSLVIIALLVLPILVFMIPVPDGTGIAIDGRFNDWDESASIIYADSTTDMEQNENINLVEFRINEKKNTVSFYVKVEGDIMKGEPITDGVGMDTVRIFLDYDADNRSGYMVNNIGADFMFDISGFNNQIRNSGIYQYDPNYRNQNDWNRWQFRSSVESAVSGSQMETQYWFSDKINSSDQFFSYIVIQDTAGETDASDVVISNLQGGALLIEQVRAPKDILTEDWEDVLELTFKAYGSPVTVNSINLNFRFNFQLRGTPLSLVIQPGEIQTFEIQIYTRDIAPRSNIEIGLTDKRQISSNADVVTISGLPAKYYIGEAPDGIIVDGSFGDWDKIESIQDRDNEIVENENINMSQYKFTQNSETLYFYFEVYGKMMGGTSIPQTANYFYEKEEISDLDGDGVPDFLDSRPNNAVDSDLDGVPDDYEIYFLNTNTSNPDTDGDSFLDGEDPDPLDPTINPRDGIPEPPPPEVLIGKDTILIFIDTDINVKTGYRYLDFGIGADILVELTGKHQFVLEKNFYMFNGANEYSWNWTLMGTADVAIDTNRLESSINRNEISLSPGAPFELYYLVLDWSNHRDEAVDTMSYEPNSTLRVRSDDLTPGTRDRNDDIVRMLKLTFSTDDPHVKLFSIRPTLMGNFLPSDIDGIIIYNDDDDDGVLTTYDHELLRRSVSTTRNDKIQFNFLEEFLLSPGKNKSVFLAIETNSSVNPGKTVGLKIDRPEDFGTNARNILGEFPLMSKLYTLENTSSRAPKPPKNSPSLSLAATYTGPASVYQGDTNVLFLTFTMTANNGDVTLSSIDIDHFGSGNSLDITAVYLEGPFGTISGNFGTFTFTPITITDATTVTFNVYLDISITARVGRTHIVQVGSIGVAKGIRIIGTAKSDRTEVFQIPEYPSLLIPFLVTAGIIFVIYKKKSNFNNKRVKNHKLVQKF